MIDVLQFVAFTKLRQTSFDAFIFYVRIEKFDNFFTDEVFIKIQEEFDFIRLVFG